MQIEKFRYFIRRLKSLRIGELLWRYRSWIRHRRGKNSILKNSESKFSNRQYAQLSESLLKSTSIKTLEKINTSIRNKLPTGWWHDNDFWETFCTLYPNQKSNFLARAESLIDGKFRLFQWNKVSMPNPVNWSDTMDKTYPGQQWPDLHFSDFQFFHDRRWPDRDVKWCWELNRCQHLLCLGAAWKITSDNRFAKSVRDYLENWMDNVSYPKGIQWCSNLEVALRLLSWMRLHILCMDSMAWNNKFSARFIQNLYLHGVHLEKELSLYRSENNHLIGEASALLYFSLLFQMFDDSSRWIRQSVRILNWIIPRLILPDGVYAEQTTGYIRFIMEFLFPILHLVDRNSIGLSDTVIERIGMALKFIKNLTTDHTNIPMIGDSDTGFAIGWDLSDFWDFSPILAAGGILLNKPYFNEKIEEFPAESFLLLGFNGLHKYKTHIKTNKSQQKQNLDNHCQEIFEFPNGGYQISRDERFSLIFDGGPLGLSPRFEHGHADGLSFLLHYNGASAIVDTGTYLYNGPQLWREYFRSTLAHNTIRIDGAEQSTPLKSFTWSKPLHIKQEAPLVKDKGRLFQGAIRWPGIIHERYILHIDNEGVIIFDNIKGKGRHVLEYSLHWAPEWNLSLRNDNVITAKSKTGSLDLFVLYPKEGDLVILNGSLNPIGGWYSRLYGNKEHSHTLHVHVTTDLPAQFLAIIKQSGQELVVPQGVLEDEIPEKMRDLLLSKDCYPFTKTIKIS